MNVDQVQTALKVAMKHSNEGRQKNKAVQPLIDVAGLDQPALPAEKPAEKKKTRKALCDAPVKGIHAGAMVDFKALIDEDCNLVPNLVSRDLTGLVVGGNEKELLVMYFQEKLGLCEHLVNLDTTKVSISTLATYTFDKESEFKYVFEGQYHGSYQSVKDGLHDYVGLEVTLRLALEQTDALAAFHEQKSNASTFALWGSPVHPVSEPKVLGFI